MARDFEENKRFFDQQRKDTEYTDRKEGLTSRFSATAPFYEADPSTGAPVGMINVRLDGGRVSTVCIIGSEMRGFDRIPNLRVKTGINKGERVCIKPADDREALIALANSLSAAGVQNQFIQSDKFTPGLVTYSVNNPGGLRVFVQEFTYADRLKSGEVNVSASVPGSANERRVAVIYYDVSANAFGVVNGTASTLPASTFSKADAVAVALGDTDRIRLGAVLLENGQTAVDSSTVFYDVRDWLTLQALADAASVTYSPDVPADWSVPPDDVAEALDALAAGAVAGAGAMILIYDKTLSGADTFDTDVADDSARTGITQAYTDLKWVYEGQSTAVGVVMTLDADTTGANYNGRRSIDLSSYSGGQDNEISSATANTPTSLETTIYSYSASGAKRIRTYSLYDTPPTEQVNLTYWTTGGAVTRIRLEARTATDFASGARLRVFGVV